MKRIFALILLLAFALSGCASLVEDSYLVVEKHSEQPTAPSEGDGETPEIIANRSQLRWAVLSCISNWAEKSTLVVENYEDDLQRDLNEIVRYATEEYPNGAYAVDFIDVEIEGDETSGTIALSIVFRRSAAEIKSIVTVNTTSAALRRIEQALRLCQSSLTFRIREFEEIDFSEAIRTYCLENPDIVPAIPDFSAEVYPPKGQTRILELHFTYPDTKEALQLRLSSVNTILTSASSYVRNEEAERAKVELLAKFLTTRFDYRITTVPPSMPAYDLLCKGLAHSLSFASIFRHECREAGIECLMVSGMRNEQPHYWNMVKIDDSYYHLDLMRSLEQKEGLLLSTRDLLNEGYVWKQEVYPETAEEETEPVTEATEPVAEPTESTETTYSEETSEPTEPTESETAETTEATEATEVTESTSEA